ncbi:hypothetical protein Pla52n_33100 [Stieleria varia]|uniref:Uncharacterized protein n=1 Tax=Stieleria varia TaxID=2528005 RepID=A0A5C6ARA7_9BACT|nr:hypothetical protein Pla52n_33100 [Stieleria varia]
MTPRCRRLTRSTGQSVWLVFGRIVVFVLDLESRTTIVAQISKSIACPAKRFTLLKRIAAQTGPLPRIRLKGFARPPPSSLGEVAVDKKWLKSNTATSNQYRRMDCPAFARMDHEPLGSHRNRFRQRQSQHADETELATLCRLVRRTMTLGPQDYDAWSAGWCSGSSCSKLSERRTRMFRKLRSTVRFARFVFLAISSTL